MTAIKVLIFNRLPLHIDFTNIPDNAYVREHIEGIKNSEYKAASSAAYSLLFQMLSDYFNMTADNIVIRQNEHGKPIIVGKNVHFNISHSKNSVVGIEREITLGRVYNKGVHFHKSEKALCSHNRHMSASFGRVCLHQKGKAARLYF